MNVFIEDFIRLLSDNGLEEFANTEIAEKFQVLTEKLKEFNAHTNITAIKSDKDVIVKHYVDSLKAERFIPKGVKMIDVGCGGGFPSLPIAIVRNDLEILAVDSVSKKLAFSEQMKTELCLSGLSVKSCRAEEMAKDSLYRESFDIVSARAVAALNVLSELCIPLLKKKGRFIAMKGLSAEEELKIASEATAKCGAKTVGIERAQLLYDGECIEHNIIIIEKINNTDKRYPRAYAQIVKKPL